MLKKMYNTQNMLRDYILDYIKLMDTALRSGGKGSSCFQSEMGFISSMERLEKYMNLEIKNFRNVYSNSIS